MKKIRLIITKDCPNNCLKCCNKNFDLDSLPIVKDYDCDELIITGGEPLSRNINKTLSLLNYLKYVDVDLNRKIFVYTNDIFQLNEVISLIDGITLSIHDKINMTDFIFWNNSYRNHTFLNFKESIKNKSLRLHIFKDVEIPTDLDLSDWEVKKDIEWADNCPLPEEEILMRTKII